ncbi:MAG: phosphoribosylaminoimidazolesuccinocarboxamide synthase [Atribacterota bacterium]
MGSVKDLVVLASPREEEPGRGKFVFSDRYSVFDWGEMPDTIPYKGMSLCLIGAYFFEKLEKAGIRTHYLGLEEGGRIKRLSELREPVSTMHIQLVRVILPSRTETGYDYGLYRYVRGNFLIPFEFIYRNMLPEESSLRKRVVEGKVTLEELGLSELPSPGVPLPEPILDVSTKLEEQDRYVSWSVIEELGILSAEEIRNVKETLLFVDRFITREMRRIGIENEDGKIELALDGNRNLILVDVVGTPDECRFTFRGMPMSKEILRSFYRKTEWYREVQKAKQNHPFDWKACVTSTPPPLPSDLIQLVSWLYQRIAMDLTQREWFPGVPSLEEIVEKFCQLV